MSGLAIFLPFRVRSRGLIAQYKRGPTMGSHCLQLLIVSNSLSTSSLLRKYFVPRHNTFLSPSAKVKSDTPYLLSAKNITNCFSQYSYWSFVVSFLIYNNTILKTKSLHLFIQPAYRNLLARVMYWCNPDTWWI